MPDVLSISHWFPLWLSLEVASLATLITLLLGLPLAYVFARFRFRGRGLLDAGISLPLILPPTVLGYYLLVLLSRNTPLGRAFEAILGVPLVFTWQGAVLAAVLHSLPLLVKSLRDTLENLPRNLENAARTLGASETRVLLLVTFPLIRRPLLAATLFAFARALGDFGVTLIIAGNFPQQTRTLTVAIYDAMQAGQALPAALIALTLLAVSFSVLYFVHRLQGGRIT